MTSTLDLTGHRAGLLTSPSSTATSDTAKAIVRLREQVRKHLFASYSVGHSAERALDALGEVRSEAASAGWNGYDAMPVDPEACEQARLFLEALPTTAPMPEISADPDGDVALDWILGERKALTVSIAATGRCTFAWIRGQRSCRGTDWLDDGIPEPILNALYQLARDVAATTNTR